MDCGIAVDVEAVGVLHQELTAPHHAEARADLVAELPLDVIEHLRHVAVGSREGAENLGDHLLVGGAEEHVPAVPVGDPQHLLAVVIVAPGLPPEIRGLDRRHQERDGPGKLLLLMDNLLDPAQHLVAERQPGVDPRSFLTDHARSEHEPVADDLRLRRGLLEDGQEISAQAHGFSPSVPATGRLVRKKTGAHKSARMGNGIAS